MLRPVDIVVLLRLCVSDAVPRSYATLAHELSLYPSEVYTSFERSRASQLLRKDGRQHHVNRIALKEFVIHGLRYAFPAERGSLVRGMATGYAAPPLNAVIVAGSDPPPVWPDAHGDIRGYSLKPLHKNVPAAARRCQPLYEVLALVDALRDGRARERNLAAKELAQRLEARSDAIS